MNFHEYRVVFVAVVGIVALFVASPAMSRLLIYPRTEFFTEFWILDSNHRAEDYPFSVIRTANYSVFLGIGNRLGHTAYYLVEVKLRNQTQSAPNSFNRTSSSLPSLLNVAAFVADEGTWEYPLTFSFDYAYNETLSQVEFSSLKLNGFRLDLGDSRVEWDSERGGFFGNLFFELWIFNAAANDFGYHERFTGLWLNMTGF
jgi:hypothetical protein